MANLWLSIPLQDYEGHMSAPEVLQADVLADLFAQALGRFQPASVAVLGVAGGNGLDRIDSSVTARVVGFDVNSAYLEEVRRRYPAAELHCVDLAHERVTREPVELVHAALIFEHAGTDLCLQNATALVGDRGALSIVLQLPSESAGNVGVSQYSSMQKLSADFTLVDPSWLSAILSQRGFRLEREVRQDLPGGKGFWHGLFARIA